MMVIVTSDGTRTNGDWWSTLSRTGCEVTLSDGEEGPSLLVAECVDESEAVALFKALNRAIRLSFPRFDAVRWLAERSAVASAEASL